MRTVRLPRMTSQDRVDVLARGQTITTGASAKTLDGVRAHVLAANVRCTIVTRQAAQFASIFGMTVESGLVGIFGSKPTIQEGYQLRVRGTNVFYSVKAVERYPSPHNVQRQVCELTLDSSKVNL